MMMMMMKMMTEKYSRKQEMEDNGYEYSIGTQDVKISGTPMFNVREVMYDPKTERLVFSSSLYSKEFEDDTKS